MLLLGATKVAEEEVALGTQSVTFASLTGNTEYTITVQGNAVTGAKAYEASAVASINLTPDGIHIEDITAAGSYAVEALSVMAVNGRNIIASDATGSILVFAAKDHGYVVNDVINVNGSVIDYNGVWEFTGPTITKTGTTAVTYPEPVEYDAAKIDAYADAPVIEYATATGVADSGARTVTVASGKVLNVYGSLADVDGRTVSINGYAFGYNNSKVNFMLVGTPTIDQSVPYLGTNPDNGQTIQWDDDEYGSASAETISVIVNGAASGYTVSFNDSANAWTVSDNGEGTITVYPKAANTSTTDDKTLTLTIAHNDNTSLTSVITLTQKKVSGFTPFNVWEDSFANCSNGSSALSSLSGSTSGFSGNYYSISTVYPMDGAIRIGKASGAGAITTPVLTSIQGSSASLTITFKAAGWNGKTAKMTLSVNKGTVTEGQTTITSETTMSGNNPSMTGTTYTFHVTGADNTTKVTFSTTNSIGVDDLVITQTAK